MPKIPKYAIYVRWGAFELNLVGRRPILAWCAGVGVVLGSSAILHFIK
jgi:hypothetical protein